MLHIQTGKRQSQLLLKHLHFKTRLIYDVSDNSKWQHHVSKHLVYDVHTKDVLRGLVQGDGALCQDSGVLSTV